MRRRESTCCLHSQARGGTLIWVALQMASGSGSELFEALLIEPMQPEPSLQLVFKNRFFYRVITELYVCCIMFYMIVDVDLCLQDRDEGNHVCIPRNCAGIEEMSSEHCANVKGSVLSSLLEAHQNVKGGLGLDHLWQTQLLQQSWMVTGVVGAPRGHVPFEDFEALLPTEATRRSSRFRLAVVSNHAPVASVFAEHVEEVIGEMDFAYYGSSTCFSPLLCLKDHERSLFSMRS